MEAQHRDVLQVEGLHLADLQAVAHRVHKVAQIVRDRIRLAVEDPIALVQLDQEYLNLRQTVAVVRFHLVLQWVARMIPRVFVHE